MKICNSEKEYIDAIVSAAQKACKRYGYLPSVLIAQSCLENGFGVLDYMDNPQITLLLEANNMVGIKSSLLNDSWNNYTVWQGESITKRTPEEYGGKMVTITDNFRKYDSIERSFCDFLLFLKYASNYGKGGVPKYGDAVLAIKDPGQLIKTVAGKGYATGSTYPTSVMRILNKHNLTKYDDLSKVEPSMIVPDSLKLKYGLTSKPTEAKTPTTKKNNVIKLTSRTIKDITAENRSQVPASRNGNPIQFIVVHYLGVPNADNPYLYGGGYGGHYNIQRNGQIYKAANPKASVVWHCGGGLQGSGGHEFHRICTNYNSIGIECGVCYTENVKDADGDSSKWYFTEETQESLVYLVSKLMDEYGISMDHVIRHYDVTGKTCLPIDSTDVLTINGWKPLSDIVIGDDIACYNAETDKIIFDKVQAVVPQYESEVLKRRYLEATADHRMWVKPNCASSKTFREVSWGDICDGKKQYLIKNGAQYDGHGLELSDDEIKFLVWIQGDGHYMTYSNGERYGLEFHLSKKRKIARIKALLDDMGIIYNENWCKNNSVHIRISNSDIIDWAEEWLESKDFSYKFIEMDAHQAEIFLEELMHVDGCESADVYTSVREQNLDVVQAVSVLNARRCSRVHLGTSGDKNVAFTKSNYSISGSSAKSSKATKRTTMVSCVTVPTGYILIRQNGRTFIVGNCPNPYVKNNNLRTSWTWLQFKANLAQYRKDGTITIPSGTTTTNVSTTPTTITTSKSYLAKGDSGDDVKTLQTMLNACGYNCGAVDGDFGSKTDKAVRELQRATGLVDDGMYGVKTKGILEQMYRNAQALKKDTSATQSISGTAYNGVNYAPVYNYSYYKQKYSDLKKAFGTDKDAYFKHFCQYGMHEARQASSAFNVKKYRQKYPDLQKAFGDNWAEYYKHYCIYGKKEGRKCT